MHKQSRLSINACTQYSFGTKLIGCMGCTIGQVIHKCEE